MSGRFDIAESPLPDLRIVVRKPLGDARGFLERMFCDRDLEPVLGGRTIAQINRTFTASRGTIRGMHFQKAPHGELKIVSCLRGEVFDVAVDVRPESPTYLRWHGEILTAGNHKTLVIPEGFAHGFQTLTDDCEMLYFHTAAHRPEAEAGLHPLDPSLAVSWPLPAGALSERDQSHPFLR